MIKVDSRVFLGNYTYKEVRKTKGKIQKRGKLTDNVVATCPQQILEISGAGMGFQSYPKWRQGAWAFESLYHPVFGHGPLPARMLALAKAALCNQRQLSVWV